MCDNNIFLVTLQLQLKCHIYNFLSLSHALALPLASHTFLSASVLSVNTICFAVTCVCDINCKAKITQSKYVSEGEKNKERERDAQQRVSI